MRKRGGDKVPGLPSTSLPTAVDCHRIVEMNAETLGTELNREPFIPLRLRLSDGRKLDILNPGLCFIARLALYVFAAKPHDALAEDVSVVSLQHIVSVETLLPQEAA